MIRLLKRSVTTALKLPVAAAWDAVSLGNFGEGSSTMRVVEEHQRKARVDDLMDMVEDVMEATRRSR